MKDEKQKNFPSTLLEKAVSNNIDLEKIEKLLDLQERWEAKEAKKAFLTAFSKFQRELPEIKRTEKVDYDIRKTNANVNYMYAPLEAIEKQVKEVFYGNGFSKSFKLANKGNQIQVTCVISHELGHSEETTMSAGADTSGSKNGIQSQGSTLTYLQRYTLIGALGLTTADPDDDGFANSQLGAKPKVNKKALENKRKEVFALGKEIGKSAEDVKHGIKEYFQVDSFNDLDFYQLDKFCDSMRKRKQMQEKQKKIYENVKKKVENNEEISRHDVLKALQGSGYLKKAKELIE